MIFIEARIKSQLIWLVRKLEIVECQILLLKWYPGPVALLEKMLRVNPRDWRTQRSVEGPGVIVHQWLCW